MPVRAPPRYKYKLLLDRIRASSLFFYWLYLSCAVSVDGACFPRVRAGRAATGTLTRSAAAQPHTASTLCLWCMHAFGTRCDGLAGQVPQWHARASLWFPHCAYRIHAAVIFSGPGGCVCVCHVVRVILPVIFPVIFRTQCQGQRQSISKAVCSQCQCRLTGPRADTGIRAAT